MKRTTKLLVIIGAAVGTVGFAGSGWAYWTTVGTGGGSAAVATLAAPVLSTPIPSTGSTVSLPWSAVAPLGGTGSVSYYVLRDNAPASAACGTSAAPITGTSCSDTGVPNGLHSYTVTAKFRSWTASSAPASVTVNGDTVPPTVTINQAAGQVDPTNSGTVNFTAVFSESVTGFGGSDVAVGGTAGLSSITKTITGGPTTYNVVVTGASGNGTIIATVPAGGAQDLAGNANVVSTSTDNTVTLDTTAPTVALGSTTSPVNIANTAITTASGTNEGGALVSVMATDGVGHSSAPVAATVTGTTWSANGINVTGLNDGTITYTATATDLAGNTATATRTATKDTVAPPAPAVSTSTPGSNKVDVTFSDSEAGVTFQCAVDTGTFSACTSPKQYPGQNGTHTFSVRAVDPAGNVSAVTTKSQSA